MNLKEALFNEIDETLAQRNAWEQRTGCGDCRSCLRDVLSRVFLASREKAFGWQSQSSPRFQLPVPMGGRYTQVRFEFLEDGSVIESGMDSRRKSGWDQKTGTFRPINPTRLKIDLGWAYGTTIYELNWQDNDHVRLRADYQTIELERVK